MKNPFIPVYWSKNQKGMQATEECNEPLYLEGCSHFDMIDRKYDAVAREEAWLYGRDQAVKIAKSFSAAGYHKQLVNRIIEPFAHITVLVSSTEWDNFLELRDHKDAEPHIQLLAKEVRKCLEDESTIQDLNSGEWHLPFIRREDHQLINSRFIHEWTLQTGKHEDSMPLCPKDEEWISLARKLSVARCASTSYKTVDGFDMTLERAVELHDKLSASKPQHLSPFEHVACADSFNSYQVDHGWNNQKQHGNFVGFRQYRHML